MKLAATDHFFNFSKIWVTISIDINEQHIVTGLSSSELFYVRNGVVNTYAMNFDVPVQANNSQLEFSWQATIRHPVSKFLNSFDFTFRFVGTMFINPNHRLPPGGQRFLASFQLARIYFGSKGSAVLIENIFEKLIEQIWKAISLNAILNCFCSMIAAEMIHIWSKETLQLPSPIVKYVIRFSNVKIFVDVSYAMCSCQSSEVSEK